MQTNDELVDQFLTYLKNVRQNDQKSIDLRRAHRWQYHAAAPGQAPRAAGPDRRIYWRRDHQRYVLLELHRLQPQKRICCFGFSAAGLLRRFMYLVSGIKLW